MTILGKKKKQMETKKEKKPEVTMTHEEELDITLKAWFNTTVIHGVKFSIDNRQFQFAIRFKGKILASDFTKIQKLVFDKEKLADYEFRPDINGDGIYFAFDLLKDNVTITGKS